MSFRVALFSSIYACGQVGLGLLLHPYQTLQSVVQEKVFVWMTLFPSMVLAALVIAWRTVLLPLLELLINCQPSLPFLCGLAFFASLWVAFFCAYWQVLLLYLFFRFSQVFKDRA